MVGWWVGVGGWVCLVHFLSLNSALFYCCAVVVYAPRTVENYLSQIISLSLGWEAVPTRTAGWLQIMVLTCMQEAGTGFASKPQTDDAEAGDIALDSWVRYDDPEVKAFKLNAERQNGRAAMMGITGCLIHELLGVDALYPTGGLGGAAPPAIF